jgi:UDP-N-acetylmuramoyl-tripeptide--D-alanyl-D-alanine ligase
MRADAGPYTAAFVMEACGAALLCGDPLASFDGISTDSRDIRENDLFVPLSGPNHNGHDFILPALEAGARGSLCHCDANGVFPQVPTNYVLFQVKDTLLSLSDLASAHRLIHPSTLIAVTGSSGKTTVKEMIAGILRVRRSPLVSEGNLNNMIGLPMTVLGLGPHHDISVVEAGINKPGEMASLAKAASPDAAVITNVGPVHLEGLGSVEAVAREKFELILGLKPGGVAVAPSDDAALADLLKRRQGRTITFGGPGANVRAEDEVAGETVFFTLASDFGRARIRLRAPGRHNVRNALAAAAACAGVGVSLDEIVQGLSDFTSPTMRMETITLRSGAVVLRDCYNANPLSMTAALDALADVGRGRRKLAVLADMKELGAQAEALHRELGGRAATIESLTAVFIGEYAEAFRQGFLEAGGPEDAAPTYRSKSDAWDWLRKELPDFHVILVKGSRAMRMEEIADRITEGAEA